MKLRTKIILGSCVPLVLVMILGMVSIVSIQSLHKTNVWVDHTHVAIEHAMEIEKLIVDLETGERGFLITGKDEFLEPYIAGKEVLSEKIETAKEHVSDNPEQVERLTEVETLINSWYEKAAGPVIAERRKMGAGTEGAAMKDVIALIEAGTGKNITDKLRTILDSFVETEKNLMQVRQNDAAQNAHYTTYTVVGGIILKCFPKFYF